MGDVVWEPMALNDLLELAGRDKRQARRIARAVQQLAESGTGDALKLQGGTGEWRLRVGDWRVIFFRDRDTIRVSEVVNRSDAYR